MKWLLRLTSLGLLLSLISAAQAQAASFGNIGLAPGPSVLGRTDSGLHYRLQPGQSISDSIHLTNTGQTDVQLVIGTATAVISRDNRFSCGLTGKVNSGWLTFSSSELKLAANSTLAVPFELIVPPNVPGGEFNSCVTLTRQSDAPSTPHGSAMSLTTRLALRVSVVTGKIDLVHLTVGQPTIRFTHGTIEAQLPIQNDSRSSIVATISSSLEPVDWSHSQYAASRKILLLDTSLNVKLPSHVRPFWGGFYHYRSAVVSRQAVGAWRAGDKAVTNSTNQLIFIWPRQPGAYALFGILGALLTYISIKICRVVKRNQKPRL